MKGLWILTKNEIVLYPMHGAPPPPKNWKWIKDRMWPLLPTPSFVCLLTILRIPQLCHCFELLNKSPERFMIIGDNNLNWNGSEPNSHYILLLKSGCLNHAWTLWKLHPPPPLIIGKMFRKYQYMPQHRAFWNSKQGIWKACNVNISCCDLGHWLLTFPTVAACGLRSSLLFSH